MPRAIKVETRVSTCLREPSGPSASVDGISTRMRTPIKPVPPSPTPEPTRPVRTHQIGVRLFPSERQELAELADERGFASPAALVRQWIVLELRRARQERGPG
jgi:hypothetical protein